jgi:hypothetical protein
MAENKKSFILYSDIIHMVRKLPPDKAGALFITILEYVNDQDPIVDDILLEVAFEPIRQQLKRDLQKWDEFRQRQSENGKRGGRPTKANETETNPKNPTLFLESQKSLNANVNVNANVTATDNVNVITNNIKDNVSPPAPVRVKREVFRPPTLEEVKNHAAETMSGSRDAPEAFHDYYTSNGWKVGRNPMKDWKAAYKNWIKREKNGTYQQPIPGQQFTGETKQQRSERLIEEWGTNLDEGRRKFAQLFGGSEG